MLRAYCEREWGPKEAKVIKLEDVNVDIFSCYLEWLYTGEAALTSGDTVAYDVDHLATIEERTQARHEATSPQ